MTRNNIAFLIAAILIGFAIAAEADVPRPLAAAHCNSIDADPWPARTPIRICALRVEFAHDTVSGTTGDGSMGSGFSDTLRIDPLPHDRRYFEDHLLFLKDYFETVSEGGVILDTSAWDIFPQSETATYQLDYPMWHYNYNSDSDLLNRRLVELFVESTAKAAEDPDVDFSRYDAIIIFHAGVGKDFNLGYDLTPFDIPSAYISDRDLLNYHGVPPIPTGVTRGLILPEGENQQEALDLGVELSLNGIFVKLFGNWLGLPDLYDTETGASGIGRWGMMDQGSGNLFAMVPAMPDAWSRVYMNWINPLVHVPGGSRDTLRIARPGLSSASQIVKLPIADHEYYLLENRDADADSVGYVELWDRDGRLMRIDLDQNVTMQEGFRVAVRASHYDFGIPGSGILVWHIDENIISEGLTDNTVNTDPKHRGVDLVEADGAQDIGIEYGFASAGSGTELGIAEDAWYLDNKAHRAANGDATIEEFSDNAFPSARFYDGSYTRLILTDFSPVDSVMSVICRMDGIPAGFPASFPTHAHWTNADVNGDQRQELWFQDQDSLFMADSSGMSFVGRIEFGAINDSMRHVDLDGIAGDELLIGYGGVGYVTFRDGQFLIRASNTGDHGDNSFPAQTVDGLSRIIKYNRAVTGDWVTGYSLDLNEMGSIDLGMHSNLINIDSLPSQRFLNVVEGGVWCFHLDDSAFTVEWSLSDARITGQCIVVSTPDTIAVYVDGIGYLLASDGTLLCPAPDCLPPAVDWDQNGIPDGGGWYGRNAVEREDAPDADRAYQWIEDVDASGDPDIIALRKVSSGVSGIDVLSHNGARFNGFPLAVFDMSDFYRPFRWDNRSELYGMTMTQVNDLYYFSPVKLTAAQRRPRFTFEEGNGNRINIGPYRPQVNTREDWLYCWPNPTSDISRIRVVAGYPASAQVKIFDIAGRKVAELSGSSQLPEPFEIQWDVSDVESGVYIGRVKLSGGTETKESEIKIAVVK